MALPSAESETDLPDLVNVGGTAGSSDISVLTQNVGGRPKIDDVWHHVTRTLTQNSKYKQVCCDHLWSQQTVCAATIDLLGEASC
jgi:hypothetical protein